MNPTISQNDTAVIQLLMEQDSLGIRELEKHLGITGTAVRQRLARLLGTGLIDRVRYSSGRGRPIHKYRLTDQGRRTAGDNLADLACALWQAVQSIDDAAIRNQVLAETIGRLADRYSSAIAGDSITDRFESIAKILADRDIPVAVEEKEGLPVLKILACPYPDVDDDNHEICNLEQQLFSQVAGQPMEMCQCRKDGDQCCSFQTVAELDSDLDQQQ